MRKITKEIAKFCIFISIASLPFITVTNIIGMTTFIDSFKNPDYYLCVQDKDNFLHAGTTNGEYIIIQKASCPDFNVENNDYIVYYTNQGEISCAKVNEISAMKTDKKFYAVNENGQLGSGSIYEKQIIGKIVKIMDDNIWNSISLKVWDISIHNLNIGALINNN